MSLRKLALTAGSGTGSCLCTQSSGKGWIHGLTGRGLPLHYRMGLLQKTALLGTVRILRKVLER